MNYSVATGAISERASIVRSRPEVPSLTGLRFAAAISVAISHGSEQILKLQNMPFVSHWLPQIAGFGMTLFFVLSGFVIHYNYRLAVTEGGISGLTSFVWARFARLYPLFCFMVLLDILLGRKLYDFMVGNSDAFLDVLRSLPYYLTFTQSWIYKPLGDSSLIYVTGINTALTWSISTEWFFYLAYPAVAALLIFVRRPLIPLIAALFWCTVWIALAETLFNHSPQLDAWAVGHYGSVAGFANGMQDSFFRWLMYFSPYLRIGEFVLGCIAAQLYIVLEDRKPTHLEHRVGGVLLALGIVSVPVLTYLMYSGGGWAFLRKLNYNFGLAPSVAIILFCAARYDTAFSRFFNTRPLIALGEASYSIYLTHFLVFVISASYLGGVFAPTLPNIVFLTAKFLFLLTLIILISLGLNAYIEVPSRRWLRGLWSPKRSGRSRIVAPAIFATPLIAAVLLWAAVPAVPADPGLSVTNGVRVLAATYGASCGAKLGNATRFLATACDGKDSCQYVVDVNKLGDPASGCQKNFSVDYQCVPDDKRLNKTLPGEAGLGSKLDLSCSPTERANPAPRGVRVLGATYGANCGAKPGNATTFLAKACDGKDSCQYVVDVAKLGDPASGCQKNFSVDYQCAPDGKRLSKTLPGEAGLRSRLELTCQ